MRLKSFRCTVLMILCIRFYPQVLCLCLLYYVALARTGGIVASMAFRRTLGMWSFSLLMCGSVRALRVG